MSKAGPLDDGSGFPGVLSHFGEWDLEVRGRQAGAQDRAPGLSQRTVMGRKGLRAGSPDAGSTTCCQPGKKLRTHVEQGQEQGLRERTGGDGRRQLSSKPQEK